MGPGVKWERADETKMPGDVEGHLLRKEGMLAHPSDPQCVFLRKAASALKTSAEVSRVPPRADGECLQLCADSFCPPGNPR